MNSINRRLNLLHGIVPQAIALLQDQQFTPDVTRILRNMKPDRQIEAVELMLASGTISVTHAEALLRATPPEQRSDARPRAKASEPPMEQIAKLLANEAVKNFVDRQEPEILEHFEMVVNTVSMEEAVQQEEAQS